MTEKGSFKSAASKAGYALKSAFAFAGRQFVSALYPEDKTCDICLDELVSESRYRLCAKCIEALPYVGKRICLECGMPIEGEGDYCLRCQQDEPRHYKLNRSPFVYDAGAKSLIYQLKFAHKKYIAETLGAFMADEFLNEVMQADIAVFVPMTSAETAKRGYNQSELIASDVARRLNMPLLPALIKVKDTPQQKGLGKEDRAKNLDGAFRCVFSQVKGRRLLLIDDVFTTGATANECAKTLIKAGAKEVSVLTAAITKRKLPVEAPNDVTEDVKKVKKGKGKNK